MTIKKVFSLACVLMALSALVARAADTQPQPAAKHSATKPRTRSFNPYDVRRTRLKINGLGFFTLLPSAPAGTSLTAVPQLPIDTTTSQAIQTSTVGLTSALQQPATSISSTTKQATAAPTAQILSAAAAELSPSALSSAAAANFIAASSVFVSPTLAADTFTSTRPPFRPPVRSPFRPPPRPPF